MSACFNVSADQNNKPEYWWISHGSERPDILNSLGLVCDNGTYDNGDYNKKNYRISHIFSSSKGDGYLLTQIQFDLLLKQKPNFQNFEKWLEKLKRKEKLEKINNLNYGINARRFLKWS